MRLSHLQNRKAMGVNMTPMIDVVFLLLIFFMTVSQVSQSNREDVELPKLPGSEDQAQTEIILNIDQHGVMRVSGSRYTVPEFITLCVDEAAREHGGDVSRLTIVIRADRRGECRTVNEVVGALTKLGILKVRFAVLSG